jgi:hypothetical protein
VVLNDIIRWFKGFFLFPEFLFNFLFETFNIFVVLFF